MFTENKINEAKYFLNRIKNAESEEDLQYNLSAFLSAARSVTFVLQKELFKKQGFKDWWKEKQEILKQNKLMELFITKRNITEKERTITPDADFDPIGYDGKFNPHSWLFMYNINEENKTAYFTSVVELSEECYKILLNLVKEAKEKFR